MFKSLLGALTASLALVAPAQAQEPIKIGMVLEMSGAFADFGMQMTNGARAYMKAHGDTVAGRKVVLIVKDTTGAPDVARRVAQELLTNDKVDFLAGFGLTPSALSVAQLATEAKKPMIVMNAATSIITTRSPYIARVSFTLPQVTAPLATWAVKNGVTRAYTLVADYGPGIDA
ncbi:MAG TPA: ABC transporter substrate-binding protein, partial [Burkholderiales bacterium]